MEEINLPPNPDLKDEIRVRFPPSPTGFLQLGNLRTVLYNYLFVRQKGGKMILRIEDTDPERSKKEYEEDIIWTIKMVGLDWDEGPDIGGPYGPYRQSEKLAVYEKYLKQLLDQGKAFYCFCPEEELETYRQYQLSQGKVPIYSGKCRSLSEEQVKQNLAENKPCNIRLKNSAENKIVFDDLVRGKVEFDPKLIGDFSLARSLRSPLYNLSVVIDDEEMKITHVIRGEDHISNTPKQILIQEALGFKRPIYGHLPIILAPDRTKLSKRHGALPVSTLLKEGYLPEAIINFTAFLGWHPQDEREIFSLVGLIKEFSMDRVQKSGAVFNQVRLDWLNGFYLRGLSPAVLTEKCLPYLIEANLIKVATESLPAQLIDVPVEEKPREQRYEIIQTKEIVGFDYLVSAVTLYQQRLKKLNEISGLIDYFFCEKVNFDVDLLKWKQMNFEEIIESLNLLEKILKELKPTDWQKENLEKILMPEAEKAGDRGKLLWPLRVALSGKEASAGPFEIASALGQEKTLARIKEAIKRCGK